MTVALSIPCMVHEPSTGLFARAFGHSTPPAFVSFRSAKVLIVAHKLVIKATAGKEDPERCNQAFTVASTAVASGVEVSLWLAGEAAWFALPGRADDFSLPYSAPLPDLLESVLALGTVSVCSQCAARRNIRPEDVISGVRISGAATFLSEVLDDDAKSLVY